MIAPSFPSAYDRSELQDRRTGMAQMIVLYKSPKDPANFDKNYSEIHIPLAKKIRGLRKYEISDGPVMTPLGPSPVRLMAILHFDSMQAMQAAFATPEGRAAGEHARSLADLDILLFDTREV
jgi:uncharacterized protein (TIGR02118 family)